ncbi:MAG: hypothetical protein RJA83_379 [Pseudomonadota bacterium]|jgi:hypothetical protein
MPKNKKRKSVMKYPVPVSKENAGNSFHWMLGALATSVIAIILYYLIRNQSDFALHSTKSETSFDSATNNPYTFFPSLPCKEGSCVQFAYHEDFNDKKSRLLINQYVAAGRKILASLPLTLANRAALAKTTIRLVPAMSDNSFFSRNGFFNGEINIVMNHYFDKEKLRSTLLNELHHLTVTEINRHKIGEKGVDFEVLSCPFMAKDGRVETHLKQDLKQALSQIEDKVGEFGFLLKKQNPSSKEEQTLSIYLAAMDDYHPAIHKLILNTPTVKFTDTSGHTVKPEINMPISGITLSDGHKAYGKVVDIIANEAVAYYSVNRDKSDLELAKAFIYDFNRKNKAIKAHYEPKYKKGSLIGNLLTPHDNLLVEIASNMDELLTPNMKKVFAPAFTDYFDRYAESYLESEYVPNLGAADKPALRFL